MTQKKPKKNKTHFWLPDVEPTPKYKMEPLKPFLRAHPKNQFFFEWFYTHKKKIKL